MMIQSSREAKRAMSSVRFLLLISIGGAGFFADSAWAGRRQMLELTQQAIDLPSNENQRKIDLYTQAIEEDSKYYLPWTNRAVCYINYGLWDLAIEDASAAIALAPENPHPWGARGRAYAGKREFEKAFADLGKALELAQTEEDTRNLYNERGNAYFSARDYEKAIRDYQQAVTIDPVFAKGWNNLGIAYRATGDFGKAFENLDRAYRFDNRSSRALVNRAQVYVAQSDRLEAAKDYNKAVELDPLDATAFIQRGMFYFLNDDAEQARADFAAAMNVQPENPYAAIYRYIAHAGLELKEDAKVQLQQYYKARTNTEFWPMPVIKLFLGTATPEEVLKAAAATDGEIRKKERIAEAEYFLAQYYRIEGDLAKSKEHLTASAQLEVPRVQEHIMAKIGVDGWKNPQPPPPRPVPGSEKVLFR